MLLQQPVLTPIATVRLGVAEMKRPIDFDSEP